MSLAENIRRFRLQKQLTQPGLAKKAKVSKAYIYMLESGDTDNPRLEMLDKIAGALDCTIADLIGEPRVVARQSGPAIPESLAAFAKKKRRAGEPLTEDDILSLAQTQFRGKRPQTVEDWAYLYEFFKRTFDSERK